MINQDIYLLLHVVQFSKCHKKRVNYLCYTYIIKRFNKLHPADSSVRVLSVIALIRRKHSKNLIFSTIFTLQHKLISFEIWLLRNFIECPVSWRVGVLAAVTFMYIVPPTALNVDPRKAERSQKYEMSLYS